MADFCKQCSIDTFGEDIGDLAGLMSASQAATGHLVPALCEGCGPTYVDHLGVCYSPVCLEKHGDDRERERDD